MPLLRRPGPREATAQPLFATLTRLLVAGVLGVLALRVFGRGIDSLFALMACGLVLYGLVMVVVMRRELGLFAGGGWSKRVLVAALGIGVAGCARAPSAAPTAAPIPVTVSYPVERDVTDMADFTGRTAAVDSVEVRARVSGYLDRVNFKEGALVKKGDMLFEIDPRPYRAEVNRAKGTVEQYEARVRRLERDYLRAKNLIVRGAVGQEEYDRYEGDFREAVAGLDVARANRDLAALNLDYTRVIAPVSGRVSRYVVTVGNLIQSGDQNAGTLLTTLVSVDPMYAYFDVDEPTVLRIRQLIRGEGKASVSRRLTQVARFSGTGHRRGIPPQGHDQFRGQPGQSKDRHPAGPGRVPQQGRGALARLFRPRPGAHRSGAPGPAGQ